MSDSMDDLRPIDVDALVEGLIRTHQWPSVESWPVSPSIVVAAVLDAVHLSSVRTSANPSSIRAGDQVLHPELGEVTYLTSHGGRAFIALDGEGRCVSLARLSKL